MSLANAMAVEISNRISNILTANGFSTDIGQRNYRGRRRITEGDLPCAVLIERPDEPDKQAANKVKVLQRYILEGHAVCDPNNPNDTGHKIIADLKKAIFTGDITLDGRLAANGHKAFSLKYLGRSIAPREDGLSMVSANIEIGVEFVEDLSNP